ncbi:MAG: hypothetical protein EOP42_32720 [Sphingobacteriaceae bacterium]|nr:MAG: hypothetical protein EOP42_32720 [Sphingobacteriaceae bacterium]
MGLFSAPEPTSFEIDGKVLQCFFCDSKSFTRKRSYLNAYRTIFNIQLTNNFICAKCSYVHTFLR